MVKLESLIGTIERTAVSVGFLKSIVPKKTKVLHYQELKKFNRTTLFKDTDAVICLIPHKALKKGHYICMLPKKGHICYFSSLGMGPSQELVKLEHEENLMSSILGKRFVYNRTRLQNQANYNINTCGAFVFVRAKFHKLKNREFIELFRNISLQNPDDIVACLALVSFMDK